MAERGTSKTSPLEPRSRLERWSHGFAGVAWGSCFASAGMVALAALADVLRGDGASRNTSFPEIWNSFHDAFVATLLLSLLIGMRGRVSFPRTSPATSSADRFATDSGDAATGVVVAGIVAAIAVVDRISPLAALFPTRSGPGLIGWTLLAVATRRTALGWPHPHLEAETNQPGGLGNLGTLRALAVASLATISLLSALQDVPWLINGANDDGWPRQTSSWAAAVAALALHGWEPKGRRSVTTPKSWGRVPGSLLLVISLLASSWQAAAQPPSTLAAPGFQPVIAGRTPSPATSLEAPYAERDDEAPPDAVATLVAVSVLVLLVNVSEALRKRARGSVGDLVIRRQSQWFAIVAGAALAARGLCLIGLENETVRNLSRTLSSSETSGAVEPLGWLDPIAMCVLALLVAELAAMAIQSAWRALGSSTERRHFGWPRFEIAVVWCAAYGMVMLVRAAVRPGS